MSEDENYDPQEIAIAQLALQLSTSSDQDLPANTNLAEMISALLDNRLPEFERAKLLSLIANNPELYSQWIELAESYLILQQSSEIIRKSKTTKTESQGLLKKLLDWWTKPSDFPNVFGSGLATATVIVLAMIMIPTQKQINLSDDLDALYKEHGLDITSLSKQQVKPTIEFSTTKGLEFDRLLPEYIRALQTGFLSGAINLNKDEFIQWGYDLENYKVLKPNELESLELSQFNWLFEVGRLSALVSIPCELDNHSLLSDTSYEITRDLLNSQNIEINENMNNIVTAFNTNTNKQAALCSLSKNIKNYLK